MSIAILGGGIVGLSIALRLAESGWAVQVFDRGPLGSEASWAGAGMLAPGGEVDQDTPLARLAVESRNLYRPFVQQLESETGVSIDLQEAGALELAYSTDDLRALEAKAARQKELGIESRSLLPPQVTTFWPRVRREDLVGARFYHQDAIVDPRDVVAGLRAALSRRGVVAHENRPAHHVAVLADAAHITTSDGAIHAFTGVVVAMGAWSSQLAVTGVPSLPTAAPVKGHLIAYHQPEQTCSTIIRLGHTYLLQRANGLLLVGASVEHVGFDRSIQPDRVSELERQASMVFPHLAETSPTSAWIGFRPGADLLHIGPWHSPRLQLAYGHYRNGILLAPLTAQTIADQINASLEKP